MTTGGLRSSLRDNVLSYQRLCQGFTSLGQTRFANSAALAATIALDIKLVHWSALQQLQQHTRNTREADALPATGSTMRKNVWMLLGRWTKTFQTNRFSLYGIRLPIMEEWQTSYGISDIVRQVVANRWSYECRTYLGYTPLGWGWEKIASMHIIIRWEHYVFTHARHARMRTRNIEQLYTSQQRCTYGYLTDLNKCSLRQLGNACCIESQKQLYVNGRLFLEDSPLRVKALWLYVNERKGNIEKLVFDGVNQTINLQNFWNFWNLIFFSNFKFFNFSNFFSNLKFFHQPADTTQLVAIR